MRLGILAKIDALDKIPKGDKLNSAKFIADYFRKKTKLVLVDWKDVDKELNVSRYLLCNQRGIFLKENNLNLNDLCDTLFFKNLGKIYPEKEKFSAFLSSLNKFKGRIVNSLQTIRNNFSKQYLLDLQKKGLPVIPTVEIAEDMTLTDVKKLNFNSRHYFGTPEDIVLKPKLFGEKGFAVRELSSFKNEREFREYKMQHFPLLAQPLIKSIFEKGENSFVFLGKKFIHAINKFTGEFKVNGRKGIVCSIHEPTEKELKICKEVIKNWSDPLEYVRIDMITFNDRPLISEIEAANPAFYIENVLNIKENFVEKLEELFLTNDR